MDCIEYTKYNNLEEIKKWLKSHLSPERYEHTLGTAEMAEKLAEMLNLDKNKAKLAGLLHDCAKCFPNEKLLDIIHTKIPEVHECELLNYKTLHAPVSAYIAKTEFGVEDREILSAIRWHTLAYCGMTDFEKIVFLADKIEQKTRDLTFSNSCLELIQEKEGLDKAMFCCFEATIKSLVDRRLAICHITIDVYNELLNKLSD